MPFLKHVHVAPEAGSTSGLWSGAVGDGPEVDAFSRAAQAVAAAYEEALRRIPVEARRSGVIFDVHDLSEDGAVVVEVVDSRESLEFCLIHVPAGFHTFPASLQRTLISGAIESGVARLIEHRGFDPAPVASLGTAVAEAGFTAGWESAWGANKSRRMAVRIRAKVEADGYSNVLIQARVGGRVHDVGDTRGPGQLNIVKRAWQSREWLDEETLTFHTGALQEVERIPADVEPPETRFAPIEVTVNLRLSRMTVEPQLSPISERFGKTVPDPLPKIRTVVTAL
jgi:hypothetical protein